MLHKEEIVEKVAENLTSPLSKSIGQTLADIWDGFLGTWVDYFKQRNEIKKTMKLEKFKQELLDEVSKVPAENQIEPNYQLTSQALEDVAFCFDSDELRGMFVKLLGKACNRTEQLWLHPSYPDIIKQMSPLDAQLLVWLNRKDEIIPLAYYISKTDNISGFKICQDNVILHNLIDIDAFQISMSISALQRCGIVEVDMKRMLEDEHAYDEFYQTKLYDSLVQEHAQYGEKIEVQKGICKVTSFGRAFIRSCVP